jgi:hypothetical protein
VEPSDVIQLILSPLVLLLGRVDVTVEATDSEGKSVFYLAYFEVKKDKTRNKRLILRVQTAFPVEELGKRRSKAGKVNFAVLLRAAHRGVVI